jgi:hypothetical protein
MSFAIEGLLLSKNDQNYRIPISLSKHPKHPYAIDIRMKRATGPSLSDLCASAKDALEDHHLTVKTEDVAEAARRRKLEELFSEIKRQLKNLEPAAPPTVAEG